MSLLLLFTPLEGIEEVDPRLLIFDALDAEALTFATRSRTSLTTAASSPTSLDFPEYPLPD